MYTIMVAQIRKIRILKVEGSCSLKILSHYSGTPLRPKAAKVEPHTHTKRYAGNFLWSWQAEWLAGACAVHTYVHRIS